MASSTAEHSTSNAADYFQTISEPKQTDTNISTRNVSGLSTDGQILYELRQLNQLFRLQAELTREEPLKSQALWNFLLQAFGLVAGTLFGVFAILAWKAANRANAMAMKANQIAQLGNSMAISANQIALVGFCQSQTDNDVCSEVQTAASESIYSYASAFYGIVPTTAFITSVSTSSSTMIVTSTGSGVGGAPTSSDFTTSILTSTAAASPTSGVESPSGSSSALTSSQIAGITVGIVIGVPLLAMAMISLPLETYLSRRRKYDSVRPFMIQTNNG